MTTSWEEREGWDEIDHHGQLPAVKWLFLMFSLASSSRVSTIYSSIPKTAKKNGSESLKSAGPNIQTMEECVDLIYYLIISLRT